MDTSSYAYDHVLRTMRQRPGSPSKMTGGAMETAHPLKGVGVVYGSLLWLYRFIIRFTVGETETHTDTLYPKADYKDATFVSKYSRATRKLLQRERMFIDIRKIKVRMLVDRLMFAGLNPAQKCEKRARISGLGRIAVYGLRYWGTRAQARARLACYDHGWWRMPETAALGGGMWDVQLPPN